MITTCTGCQTRYRLDDTRVPRRRLRVRCPRCASVFALDGTQAARVSPPEDSLVIERASADIFAGAAPSPATPAAPPAASLASPPRPVAPVAAPAPATPVPAPAASLAEPVAAAPAAAPPAAAATAPVAGAGAAVLTEPSAAEPDGRPRRDRGDKARRLARALVSDILVYNRDLRDRSLQEGNLIQALGPEIKKSWELYKERVTPEVANSTSHFRDALNDILANGQKVF